MILHPPPPPTGFRLLVGFLTLIAVMSAANPPAKPEPEPPAGESTLALTPLEVRAETMEFSKWLRLTSPHFVLYTDASAKEASLAIRHLEMLHQAAQFFLHRKALDLPPAIVVLPTGRSDWNKIGSRGTVKWQVAGSLLGSTRSLFLIQYDWQADGLDSLYALVGTHELNLTNLDGPLWFDLGIANFFRTVAFQGDTLTIGKQGTDAYWLRQYGWMAWPRFFQIKRSSKEYTQDSNAHSIYAGQAGVFAHYLLTHEDPASTERLLTWAAYLHAGNEPTDQAFMDVFKVDTKTMQGQITKMLDGGNYKLGTIRFPPAALQFPVTTDRPPTREMRELFVLAQIQNQDTSESVAALDALLARGLKSEALRELLVDACLRRQPKQALPQLRQLIAAGSTNPLVYVQAAEFAMKEVTDKPGPQVRLGDAAAEIRTWCLRALERVPLHPGANEALAWAEALGPTVDKENVAAITQICRRLDSHAPTDNALTALAVARFRAGNTKSARTLATQVIDSLFSRPAAKTAARELLTLIDAAPAAAVAAP
jgi:hypothetical protein